MADGTILLRNGALVQGPRRFASRFAMTRLGCPLPSVGTGFRRFATGAFCLSTPRPLRALPASSTSSCAPAASVPPRHMDPATAMRQRLHRLRHCPHHHPRLTAPPTSPRPGLGPMRHWGSLRLLWRDACGKLAEGTEFVEHRFRRACTVPARREQLVARGGSSGFRRGEELRLAG